MSRRLFSPKIVCSDAFLDMPTSSQALYLQLGMNADDDGFVQPKRILRSMGAADDDLKVLLAKKFILPFESGVIVIKHWRINNSIRKDRYVPSEYFREREQLFIRDNGAYTFNQMGALQLPIYQAKQGEIDNGNQMATKWQAKTRQDKVIQVKTNKDKTKENRDVPSQDIVEIINSFREVNPSYKVWFGNKTQRNAIERLLETHGKEQLLKVIGYLPKSNTIPYVPTITSPYVLETKWADLEAALYKLKNKSVATQPKVAFS